MSKTVDQLWYTASPVGLQTVGFQVRAASAGLRDLDTPRFRMLEGLLRYQLPTMSRGANIRPDDAPVTIALLKVGNERVLVHKMFVGLTWDSRPGNFFIHLLAGLPDDFTACDAIETWESPDWIHTDTLDRRTFDLPQIDPYSLRLDPLACGDLSQITREQLTFVIRAFLHLRPEQRLFLAAPPRRVATLIWGLTRCLPLAMIRRLTFSTYEQDVSQANAPMIVGTAAAPNQPDVSGLLSQVCYGVAGLALNLYSGQQSTLTGEDERIRQYAAYAVEQLFSNTVSQLDGLFQIVERHLSPDDTTEAQLRTLLSVYHFYAAGSGSGEPTQRDISDLLKQPSLAADLLGNGSIQQQLVHIITISSEWWQRDGRPGIMRLQQLVVQTRRADVDVPFTEICAVADSEARWALERGNWETAERLIDGLVRSLKPPLVAPAWRNMLDRLPVPPPAYTLDPIRLRLLLRWAEHGVDPANQPQLLNWLNCSWDDLRQMLEAALPSNWQQQALVLAISRQDPPPNIDRILEGRYSLVKAAVMHLLHHDRAADQAVISFYTALNQRGYSEGPALLRTILDLRVDDIPFIERLFSQARPSALSINLLQNEPRLLTNLSRRQSVAQFLTRYLDRAPVEQIREAESVIKQIADTRDDLPMQMQAQAWVNVLHFFRHPSSDRSRLDELRHSLNRLADPQNVLSSSPMLDALIYASRTAESLAAVVSRLEPLMGLPPTRPKTQSASSQQSWQLFERLYQYVLQQQRSQPLPIAPYVELALSSDYRLPKNERELVLKGVQQIGRKAFDEVEHESKRWPSFDARNNWRQFADKNRPATLSESVQSRVSSLVHWVCNRWMLFLVLLLGLLPISVLINASQRRDWLSWWSQPALQQGVDAYDLPNGRKVGALEVGQRYRPTARYRTDWLRIDLLTLRPTTVWVQAVDAGLLVDERLPDLAPVQPTEIAEATALATATSPAASATPTARSTPRPTAPPDSIKPALPEPRPTLRPTTAPASATPVRSGVLTRQVVAYAAPDGVVLGRLEPGLQYKIVARNAMLWLHIEAPPPTNRVWILAAEAGLEVDPTLPD